MTAIAPASVPTPVVPRSGRASWGAQTGQVFRRWIVGTWRQVWGPAMSLLQPVIWIVLFGQVYSALGALPVFADDGYIGYLVPGILMMTVLYSGAWAGTGYIDDIDSGVMDQLLSAPLSRSAIVTGQLLQQLLVNALQSGVVLGIGALAGARYPGGVLGVLVTVIAATLLATVFCCASSAVALLTRNQVALIGLSQLIVLPATFLSTTMMPVSLLPEWVQAVARWNPMTWAVEFARAGLDGSLAEGADAAMLALDGAGLVVLAALGFLWTVRSMRAYQRSL